MTSVRGPGGGDRRNARAQVRYSPGVIPFLSGLFVVIWATGFILAGVVAGRADPLTFLAVRHACSIVVFTALSFAAGAAWPRSGKTWRDAMVAGMLLHGF